MPTVEILLLALALAPRSNPIRAPGRTPPGRAQRLGPARLAVSLHFLGVDDLALFFHLLGALLFVAGVVLAGAAFEVARRCERPSEVALLLGLTRIGVGLVGVGALLLLAFGVWLVHLESLSYAAGWIGTSMALYLVALGLGAVGGRRPKQARRLAAKLAAQDDAPSAELRSLLNDRASRAVNYTRECSW